MVIRPVATVPPRKQSCVDSNPLLECAGPALGQFDLYALFSSVTMHKQPFNCEKLRPADLDILHPSPILGGSSLATEVQQDLERSSGVAQPGMAACIRLGIWSCQGAARASRRFQPQPVRSALNPGSSLGSEVPGKFIPTDPVQRVGSRTCAPEK